MKTEERAVGCLAGLALGDAYGAPYEGGPVERLVWRVLGRTMGGLRRWTDDTAMSLVVAESLTAIGGVDQDDIARRFAEAYRWSRGYGPGAARVLKQVRGGRPWRAAALTVYPGGSYGNGAAMRSPVIAIAFSGHALRDAAADIAVVTHGHPLAVEGAQLVATAVDHALDGDEPAEILSKVLTAAVGAEFVAKLNVANELLQRPVPPAAADVRTSLGCAVTALDSCVTAIFLGLSCCGLPFEELLTRAREVGGDVDTIGAMAGAIWGARRGAAALPTALRRGLEAEPEIVRTASALYRRFHDAP